MKSNIKNKENIYRTELILTVFHPIKKRVKIAGVVTFNVSYYILSESKLFR